MCISTSTTQITALIPRDNCCFSIYNTASNSRTTLKTTGTIIYGISPRTTGTTGTHPTGIHHTIIHLTGDNVPNTHRTGVSSQTTRPIGEGNPIIRPTGETDPIIHHIGETDPIIHHIGETDPIIHRTGDLITNRTRPEGTGASGKITRLTIFAGKSYCCFLSSGQCQPKTYVSHKVLMIIV